MDFLIHSILLPWWFALPGYIGNICPGLARKFPGGTAPVSVTHLGPNKTWAAIPAALTGAGTVAYLQSLLSYPLAYPATKWWVVALCFGFGVPLGDWSKSFLKRRRGIAPGGKWWVEKIDFLVASFLLFAVTGTVLPLPYYLVPVIFYILVHGPGNAQSFKLGWRNSPH